MENTGSQKVKGPDPMNRIVDPRKSYEIKDFLIFGIRFPYAPQGKEVVHDGQPFLFDVILYFCRDKKRVITALITQKLGFMINWKEHITSDKNILLGKPTIKGTRISIEHLIGLFAQGWSEQQILDNYPKLTNKDLFAVFAYVREGLEDGVSGGGNIN